MPQEGHNKDTDIEREKLELERQKHALAQNVYKQDRAYKAFDIIAKGIGMTVAIVTILAVYVSWRESEFQVIKDEINSSHERSHNARNQLRAPRTELYTQVISLVTNFMTLPDDTPITECQTTLTSYYKLVPEVFLLADSEVTEVITEWVTEVRKHLKDRQSLDETTLGKLPDSLDEKHHKLLRVCRTSIGADAAPRIDSPLMDILLQSRGDPRGSTP